MEKHMPSSLDYHRSCKCSLILWNKSYKFKKDTYTTSLTTKHLLPTSKMFLKKMKGGY
jgi:hypothetical protein